MEWPNIFLSVFIRFFYSEKIGVDTKIMILFHLEVEILPKLDFHGGHLKKWPKPISRLKVFPLNIANNIPKKLLIKWSVVGVHGEQFWLIGLPVSIIKQHE